MEALDRAIQALDEKADQSEEFERFDVNNPDAAAKGFLFALRVVLVADDGVEIE